MEITRRQFVSRSAGTALAASLALRTGAASAAQEPARPAAPEQLRVSDNRRFLIDQQGRPFFYLGDTAWELFHRLNREEAERYLSDRAAKGFTVIQAVVLAELNGLHDPNPYGHTPLKNDNPTQPQEPYFEHVDWIVRKANALGLVIGMLPTWGDKWNKQWGVGPEIFTPDTARAYGRWLGERYRDSSLIWILGGDRTVDNETHLAIIRAMAEGIRAGDAGRHLMTFHPTGGRGSAEWFHDDGWLAFNMRQNGHEQNFSRYAQTRADYDRAPIKPVLDGEPVYEDHPIAFKPDEHGHSVAADVRRPLYWDLFGGACGHTYGHHSVWQMWAPPRAPINNPLLPWFEAIDQPGAGQMQFARRLLESRPFLSRVPDDSVVVADRVKTSVPGAGLKRLAATRDADGSYALVYCPVGRPFRVRLESLSGERVESWWFNPRSGEATRIGEFAKRGEQTFVPPDPGEMLDWVLVLDDPSRGFPPPGQSPHSA
jgi:hypothetical protein